MNCIHASVSVDVDGDSIKRDMLIQHIPPFIVCSTYLEFFGLQDTVPPVSETQLNKTLVDKTTS